MRKLQGFIIIASMLLVQSAFAKMQGSQPSADSLTFVWLSQHANASSPELEVVNALAQILGAANRGVPKSAAVSNARVDHLKHGGSSAGLKSSHSSHHSGGAR